jgi:hypothetical protein
MILKFLTSRQQDSVLAVFLKEVFPNFTWNHLEDPKEVWTTKVCGCHIYL